MADYRLYFLDEANHIRGVVEFACNDDLGARALADRRADGRRMELWNRARLVQRFEAQWSLRMAGLHRADVEDSPVDPAVAPAPASGPEASP